MKPFIAHLTEQEEDFEYKLCSVKNIHDPDVLADIRLALERHGLISLEPDGIITQFKNNDAKQFAEYPFQPVYICKLIMAHPMSSHNAVQSLALFTRIPSEELKVFDKQDRIVMDGPEVEQHAHPVEVDSKAAQSEVGMSRVDDLVSDLMKGITKARKDNVVETIGGCVASHHEIKKMLGKNVRRGFYIVEYTTDGGTVLGPFRKVPDNYDYGMPRKMNLREQRQTKKGLVEYKVDFHEPDIHQAPDDAPARVVMSEPMEVEVVDQDTGRRYSVVVKAASDMAARTKAVEVLAAKIGVEKARLLPTSPESE